MPYPYIIVVLILLLVWTAFHDMVGFVNGTWVTPTDIMTKTNKYVFMMIAGQVVYIISQEGQRVLANSAFKMEYSRYLLWRWNLNDFSIPIRITPAVDLGSGPQEEFRLSVMLKDAKMILFDKNDAVITAMQKSNSSL